MLTTSYSIRESLQGKLQDFLQSSGFLDCTATANLVRDFTALLAAYREEDTPLYPSVFVLPTVDQLTAIAPGTAPLVIGLGELAEIDAEQILKDCAPLAHSGWSIFVGKFGGPPKFQYGLFRSLAHTVATSADETMEHDADSSAVILIRNRGHLAVELRNSRKGVFTASLTSAEATESHLAIHARSLADGLASDLSSAAARAFKPYAYRFLTDTLQRCHGTLCAVIKPPPIGPPPAAYAKSVWLNNPLTWQTAHAEATLHKTADALANLQAIESLVIGMVNSDGVVIFGSNGTVLGYRAFLNPNDGEAKAEEGEGGGRKRTYRLMVSRLGPELRAAFFRSQDGKCECKRSPQ